MNMLDVFFAVAIGAVVAAATITAGSKVLTALENYDPLGGIQIVLPEDPECEKVHPVTGLCKETFETLPKGD